MAEEIDPQELVSLNITGLIHDLEEFDTIQKGEGFYGPEQKKEMIHTIRSKMMAVSSILDVA